MKEERFITSLQHPFVKHLVKLRTDSSYRNEQKIIVVEGLKPIKEVYRSIAQLFYTASFASHASSLPGEKWEITEGVLHKISGMNNPEGIVAVVRMPPYISLDKQSRVLALDGISDPGNLGTLLRTALALGWEAVYFLPGGCDPFNDKAIRAARGAHFKLVLVKGTIEELRQWTERNKVQALVADLHGQSPCKISEATNRLLVLGNEAHGASAETRHFCNPVTIPMPGEMESLNVAIAGGILLYLFSTSNR